MKAGLHPKYAVSKITCSTCDHVIEVGNTAGDITVEICSNCHPFYTGAQRLVDTAGRVERFNRKYNRK